jgi:hypothetical protein
MPLSYDEMTTSLDELLNKKQDFEVFGLSGRLSDTVTTIESRIEAKGMTCRVYTVGRSAAIAAGLFSGVVGVATAVGIAAHNLATYDPDYEIGKNLANNTLRVIYQKR